MNAVMRLILFLGLALFLVQLLGSPSWPVALMTLAIFVVILLTATHRNLSKNLQAFGRPEAIPDKKRAVWMKAAGAHITKLDELGFDQAEECFLRTVPESAIWLFVHRSEPAAAAVYVMQTRVTYEFSTDCENDLALSTTHRVSVATMPRRRGRLIQIFENASHEQLLEEHLRAVRFIGSKDIEPVYLPPEDIGRRCLEDSSAQLQFEMSVPLWQLRMPYWAIVRRGRRYRRSIEEQCSLGMIDLRELRSAISDAS